jgi:hypothetical protein
MQVFVRTLDSNTICLSGDGKSDAELLDEISTEIGIPTCHFCLETFGGSPVNESTLSEAEGETDGLCSKFLQIKLSLNGGIDFQHREGSKIGSGGQMSESQAALERKERLRKLALEMIDITKDPYIIRNNLGTFECKLCLTVHPNEGNYLAHTQGKRHQYNLGRRAALEAKNANVRTATVVKDVPKKNVIRIGRPGYKVRFAFYAFFFSFCRSLTPGTLHLFCCFYFFVPWL